VSSFLSELFFSADFDCFWDTKYKRKRMFVSKNQITAISSICKMWNSILIYWKPQEFLKAWPWNEENQKEAFAIFNSLPMPI
jgi:hypothetical protein